MHRTMLKTKQKRAWLAGTILVLIITTCCAALVVTGKNFSNLANRNDCDQDQDIACRIRPWLEPTHDRALTATFSTSIPVTSSPLGTDGAHLQLVERVKQEPDRKRKVLQSDEHVQEDDSLEMDSHVEETVPSPDAQTEYSYVEEAAQEQNEESTTQKEGADLENLENLELTVNESEDLEELHACFVNGDCGTGYQCFEGQCRPGCSKHLDCPTGYECRYGRYGHRCFQKTGWHRECKVHLRFCWRHDECCSGYCSRRFRGQALMCRRPEG